MTQAVVRKELAKRELPRSSLNGAVGLELEPSLVNEPKHLRLRKMEWMRRIEPRKQAATPRHALSNGVELQQQLSSWFQDSADFGEHARRGFSMIERVVADHEIGALAVERHFFSPGFESRHAAAIREPGSFNRSHQRIDAHAYRPSLDEVNDADRPTADLHHAICFGELISNGLEVEECQLIVKLCESIISGAVQMA